MYPRSSNLSSTPYPTLLDRTTSTLGPPTYPRPSDLPPTYKPNCLFRTPYRELRRTRKLQFAELVTHAAVAARSLASHLAETHDGTDSRRACRSPPGSRLGGG